MPTIQVPAIILPTVAPLGTEVEAIADILQHVSLEPIADDNGSLMHNIYEKTAFVYAQEIVAAGVPGDLQIWVEESPYPSTIIGTFWAQLAVPAVIVGTGVNLTIHTIPIHWNVYSPYIRLVAQTPVLVATAVWAVQIIYCGQGR